MNNVLICMHIMEVKVIKPFGYCAGVEHAILMAINVKLKNPNRHVVILGMLVHNHDTLKMLKKEGVDVIYEKGKTYLELIDKVKDDDIVILTAHGHALEVETILKDRHIEYVDTTCPFVKKNHERILKALNEGHEVIYIGKENHPEAIAALSLNKDRVHLLDVNKNNKLHLKDESPFVVNQTTLSELEISQIVENLYEIYPKAIITDTVCYSSSERQKAILSIDKDTDIIYVLGSTISNNTLTLKKLAEESHPNSKVIMIENASFINKEDLKGVKKVAITSGASTSKETVLEVKEFLENI